VAISGESVRACSRSLKYAVTGQVLLAHGVVGEKRGRKRPGKKRRIHLRKILAREKALEEAKRKSIAGLEKYKGLTPEEREEVAKAERARKNREKKIRERAKKRTLREMRGEGMEKSLG
jgi:D-serine deaminase-like pyridoxal phosphate-dependent protein